MQSRVSKGLFAVGRKRRGKSWLGDCSMDIICNKIGCGARNFIFGRRDVGFIIGRNPGEVCGDCTGGIFRSEPEDCPGRLVVLPAHSELPRVPVVRCCYAITSLDLEPLQIKIGKTTDLFSRLKQIQNGCGVKCFVLGVDFEIGREGEHHRNLRRERKRGEWFCLGIKTLRYIQENFVSTFSIGLDCWCP